MTRHSALLSAVVLTLPLASAASQTVTGRVADSAGIPVPHVRILVHPVGDSSEVASRIAFSNDRGEFKLHLDAARPYVVRARRIGYAAAPDRVIDFPDGRDTTVSIVLSAIEVALAPVRVVAVERRCLVLNDPAQSTQVREWFEQATSALFARRVVERDFWYRIEKVRSLTPAPRPPASTMIYMHRPGATNRDIVEDDPANLAAIARAVVGGESSVIPSEATLLYPTFRVNYCFDNVLDQGDDGSWTLKFRDIAERPHQPGIAGALVFAADGSVIERAEFNFLDGKRVAASAHLAFTRVALDSESFPILTTRGAATLKLKDQTRPFSVQELFSYSGFARSQ